MRRRTIWIFVLFMLAAAAPALAQSDITVEDPSGRTVGRIRTNGAIENATGWTIGRIRDNGNVEDSSGWTIGRVREDGTIENASGWTVGRIRDNGTVEDAAGWSIGRIASGSIDNSSGMTALRYSGPDDLQKLGAYLFFFNKALGK